MGALVVGFYAMNEGKTLVRVKNCVSLTCRDIAKPAESSMASRGWQYPDMSEGYGSGM